jgi:hypothetical protein
MKSIIYLTKKIKSFYDSGELVYFNKYMPKPGDVNQVYFPYCKFTLDTESLLNWLSTEEIDDTMLEALDIALFNKDKQSILSTIQPLK